MTEDVAVPGAKSQGSGDFLWSHYFGKEALGNLPIFSGGTLEYRPWKRQVYPLLMEDRRGRIPTFNSLKKLLKGEALLKVAHVDVTLEDPVGKVFDLLDKHYDQPGAVMAILLSKVDALSTPSAADPDQLEQFVNTVRQTVSTFEVNGQLIGDQYWFFNKVWKKLSSELSAKWAEKTPEHRRNLENLLSFLEERENTLRGLPQYVERATKKPQERVHAGAAAVVSKPTPQPKAGKGSGSAKPNPRRLMEGKRIRPKPGVCPHCSSPRHGIESCERFLALSPANRLCRAFETCLCFKCLGVHHKVKCPLPGDYKCPKEGCNMKHHLILHGSAGKLDDLLEVYMRNKGSIMAGKTGGQDPSGPAPGQDSTEPV